jgi:hypothetical protein
MIRIACSSRSSEAPRTSVGSWPRSHAIRAGKPACQVAPSTDGARRVDAEHHVSVTAPAPSRERRRTRGGRWPSRTGPPVAAPSPRILRDVRTVRILSESFSPRTTRAGRSTSSSWLPMARRGSSRRRPPHRATLGRRLYRTYIVSAAVHAELVQAVVTQRLVRAPVGVEPEGRHARTSPLTRPRRRGRAPGHLVGLGRPPGLQIVAA